MGYIIALAVFGGLILFIVLIRAAFGCCRKRVARVLQQTGFEPVEQPDTELLRRIGQICKSGSDDPNACQVYCRHENGYELYCLTHRSSGAGPAVLLVRSSRLDLPSLVIDCRIPVNCKIVQLLNEFGEQLVGRVLPRVNLSRFPALAARYRLFSNNSHKALSLLTPQLMRMLLESEYVYVVSAEDNMFGFALRHRSIVRSARRLSRLNPTSLRILMSEGQRLLDHFVAARQQPTASVQS